MRRDGVWEIIGQRPRSVLVVSHGWYVPIGEGQVAVVDHLRPTAKAVFARRVRVVGSQVVMDVNNSLFKILSTS